MKTKRLFKVLCVCLLTLISCSENSSDTTTTKQEEQCTKTCDTGMQLNTEDCSCEEIPCTKTCDTGFVLNSENCECEKEPCTKTCDTGFTLNNETCECEKDAEPFKPVVLKVETETATLSNPNWKIETEIAGYNGTGYIIWKGNSRFGAPKVEEALTYKVTIAKAGNYHFKWKSYIAKKVPGKASTEHNDSWVRFPDANDFFAVKNKEGQAFSRKVPQSKHSFYFKAYMNTIDKWNNWCSTIDHNSHAIYVTFDTPGEYTVSIAPRSDYHAIDQFTLTEVAPDVRLK
ncbi:hypothetical protein [Wenyingzhuangia sp. IMCC45574]